MLGKINQVARNEPFNLSDDITQSDLTLFKSWYDVAEFRVMVAALDMFWNKFLDSRFSKLRVCTLNSRYKDCSSLSEVRHLCKISAKPLPEISTYIFSARVRDEIEKLGESKEEPGKEDSYFPYMRDMPISKKSPYSSTENVNLHNWISMFCTLLGSERSYNARIVSEDGLLPTMHLAMFAANAFRSFTTPEVVFGTDTNKDLANEMRRAKLDESDDAEFDSTSAIGVYFKMLSCDNIIPKEMTDNFVAVLNKMGPAREKTIGMFLRRNII